LHIKGIKSITLAFKTLAICKTIISIYSFYLKLGTSTTGGGTSVLFSFYNIGLLPFVRPRKLSVLNSLVVLRVFTAEFSNERDVLVLFAVELILSVRLLLNLSGLSTSVVSTKIFFSLFEYAAPPVALFSTYCYPNSLIAD
jgi:hypothetical protein